MMTDKKSYLPLKGIRVLDLSRLYPGPFCSMILSDFGADVIRIEDKKYETEGLGWDTIMRNKSHMTLNLKNPKGLDIFYRLVKKSDVVIEGFRPGVTTRLKIDYNTLRKLRQDLVYCSISGYGQNGPYKLVVGHDINYIGLSGILYYNRHKLEKPAPPPVQIADAASGGLYSTIGILLALMVREKTGKGQYIDISMLDGLVSFLPFLLDFFFTKGKAPSFDNCHVLGAFPYYNIYQTKDGNFISLGTVESRFWETLCKTLGREDFVPYQNDESKKDEITQYFEKVFQTKTRDEWWEELKEVDLCLGKVLSLEEVLKDPQVLSRKMIQSINGPKGRKIRIIGQPIKMSKSIVKTPRPPASCFGEHTEKILKSLGFHKQEIEQFRKEGVL